MIVGIDVSHWNSKVDWKKVKEGGASFAFIKATEGTFFLDNRYIENFEGAWSNNIHVAPYHFISPRSNAQAQAEFFCKKFLRQPDEMLLTPVLDIEWDFKRNVDQWLNMNRRERIEFIFTIIKVIEDKIGRKPIIYTSIGFWDDKIDTKSYNMNEYPLWVAHYTKKSQPSMPKSWTDWTFWQFDDNYMLPNYQKRFDGNRYNENSDVFNKLKGDL